MHMNRSESQDVLTDRLSIVTKRVSRNSFVFHDRYTEWVAMIFFFFFFLPISPSGSQCSFFERYHRVGRSVCVFWTDITEWVAACVFLDRYHLVGRRVF